MESSLPPRMYSRRNPPLPSRFVKERALYGISCRMIRNVRQSLGQIAKFQRIFRLFETVILGNSWICNSALEDYFERGLTNFHRYFCGRISKLVRPDSVVDG